MKKILIKVMFLAIFFAAFTNVANAQKGKKRSAVKRGNSTVRKNTKSKTKATVNPTAQVDSLATAVAVPAKIDSLPITKVKKSLRADEAVSQADFHPDSVM